MHLSIWRILVALSCVIVPGLAVASEPLIDSHFHVANYAMQGVPLKTLIDDYMGERVQRSVVFALPLQQKWDAFEHYAKDLVAPNYYMGPKAGMYYYSFVDAMLATDFLKLKPEDQRRLDPMMVGFNPMDHYAKQHVQRVLLMYPGVFVGIGEFSVHKEIVGEKISDDLLAGQLAAGVTLDDISPRSRNSLHHPALKSLLDFSAEAGLIVSLHSDIYPTEITYDGRVLSRSPNKPYTEAMKQLCRGSPNASLYWAHTGLGRFVTPSADHLLLVADVLDACPNWSVDVSWDLVQAYIVSPGADMPTLEAWVRFVKRYQDRVLWGSDTVIFTRNKLNERGQPVLGGPMPVADYAAVTRLMQPLWDAVGPDVERKIKAGNHTRLFDAARTKVRAWERANAHQNIWNLPQ
jgi:hypothetical protein